eukprot:scaffold96642_cov54-Phaeocystis_antarctica.AAC.3
MVRFGSPSREATRAAAGAARVSGGPVSPGFELVWHTVGQQLVDSKEEEAVLARAVRRRKQVRVHVDRLHVRHVPAHHVGQGLECQRRRHACGAVARCRRARGGRKLRNSLEKTNR